MIYKNVHKRFRTLSLFTLALLVIASLPMVFQADAAASDPQEGTKRITDVQGALVEAGYRPRYPFEGSPFIQTPSPVPEDAVLLPYGEVPMGLSSSTPTRANWKLYYNYSVLETYVDISQGALNANEWLLLSQFCDDFVNISYGRSKDHFDPLDRIDDVVFYVYNIDGQSGVGGYYQPGTDYFFVDRADLSWAGVIIAHEFQHYVHRQYDPYENLWVDEGFADLSAYLTYGLNSVVGQHAHYYLKYYPTTSLVVTDYQFQSNIVHYGSSFLYALYMMEHYGGKNYTRTLVKTGQRGTSAVDSALISLGYSDRFEDTFFRWKVATRVNDDYAGEDGEYAYSAKTYSGGASLNTILQGSYSGVPVLKQGSINGYGPVSLRFGSPPVAPETYRLKIEITGGDPNVALYEESSAPREVLSIPFSGSSAVYDITDWGVNYTSFQLILSSSGSGQYSIDLDILDLEPPVTQISVMPRNPDGMDGWYVSSPKVTLTTEQGATIKYSMNGGELKAYSSPLFIPEGTYNLSYYSMDKRGNTEGVRFRDFSVDLTTPTTSMQAEPEKVEGEWYTRVPTIYLYTSHIHTDIHYKWGGIEDDYTIYTDPLEAPEGEHTLYWYGMDQAGNKEEMNHWTFRVDTIAPGIEMEMYPAQPDGLDDWYATNPQLILSSETGASVQFSLNGKDWFDYETPITLEDGDHDIRYRAVDEAGNQGDEGRKRVKVDTSVPTIEWSFDIIDYSEDNSSMWLSTVPTLTLWSNEDRADITFSLNEQEPEKYMKPISFPQGANTLWVYGMDAAGNEAEPLFFQLKVDTIPPRVEAEIDAQVQNDWYRSKDVTITLESTESSVEGSPVSIFYKWDEDDWSLYRSPIEAREGTHKLSYRAMDAAGNYYDVQTVEIKKDSVEPSIFMDIEGIDANSTVREGMNITVDLTESLDESGISLFYVDFGDGTTRTWTVEGKFRHSYEEPGTYTITGAVKDSAGNVRNETYQVTVDASVEDEGSSSKSGSDSTVLITVAGAGGLILLLVVLIEASVIVRRRRRGRESPLVMNPNMGHGGRPTNSVISGGGAVGQGKLLHTQERRDKL